jgi:uncharacterized cupin superfamily protein
MPKLDLEAVPIVARTSYPAPHDVPVRGRSWRAVAKAGGLTDFGANVCTLPPGTWSSQRHWHSIEDELVVMLTGELVLVTDAGEEPLRPGDVATFPKNVPDGHHLQNRSDAPATFLVVGRSFDEDEVTYSDVDLFYSKATGYVRKTER